MTLVDLPQEVPVVTAGVTLRSLSEAVSDRVLRSGTPRWWWIGFGISLALLVVLLIATGWLFIRGIGVWGIDIPVAWGLAIAEYVWWIALASGGTIVSALFYLTRSPWRAAISRIAESMMLCAAASAAIMPLAPGRFSTTIETPWARPICSAIRRDRISGPLPGV
jgi:molybdopterin-containing oxidoreductase family membrane subunit